MAPLPSPPADGRLARRLIFWTAGCVVALILAVGIYLVYHQDYATPSQPVAPPPSEVQTAPIAQDPGEKPATRAGTNRLLSPQAAQASIPTATAFPAGTATHQSPQQQPVQQDAQKQEGASQQKALPPLGTKTVPQGKDAKSPSKYLFAPTDNVAKSPFSAPESPSSPENHAAADKTGSLFKDSGEEIPADPSMVWYMSQALSCVVTGQIVSDIPGQIVCRVDRALEDKFLAGNVLVPQHSLLVARPESAVDGFDRLAITIRQIEKPNGAAIPLSSKASDAYGAGGLSGDVNRHIPQKVFGILATAVLSVGVRVPAGNTDAFIPTLGQQTAAQAGQGLSQAGQAIVQKQFSRPDTITVPPGMVMLIYPDTNISFAKPAKVVQ